MAKFNAFRNPVVDAEWCDYLYRDGVRFKIRRSGYKPFAKRLDRSEANAGAVKLVLQKLDAKGLKPMQARDIEWEEAVAEVQSELSFGDFTSEEIMARIGGGETVDAEGVALLVAEMDDQGEPPLIVGDNGERLDWTPDLGRQLFEAHEATAVWVLGEANRIEAAYQAAVEASAQFLDSSSASNTTGTAAAEAIGN